MLKCCLYLLFLFYQYGFAHDRPGDYFDDPSTTDEVASDPYVPDFDYVDLEEMSQDFVLETKRIRIPGYPDAFNPSIIRYQGCILLSFRKYDRKTRATNEIGLIWLDENFHPISEPQFLEIPYNDPFCISKRQDARLLMIGEKLFIIYNNVLKDVIDREVRRMVIAEIHFDGTRFITAPPDCFINFDGERIERSEKNWVPFEYNGELLLAYSIVPHRIVRPLLGLSTCENVASSLRSIKWNWGVLRGGTQAFLNDGEYLAFFHCSKSMATAHSGGKSIPHYFMGAYTFESRPPFSLTRISPKPIVGKDFYHGPAYKTWKPLRVVFPAGYLFDDQYIWIVYGRQDHEMWVAKLDKKGLLGGLVPVLPNL